MEIIRKASPEGAFIKLENGRWFEVSERYAREKVGAWYRDCLHTHYKSSSKAKHARKMAQRVSFNSIDADDLMNFPLDNVEFDLSDLADISGNYFDDIDRPESMCSTETTSSSASTTTESITGSGTSFYDIDEISLIPLDAPVL
jgi:hypothetical protein